jgi:hypothetical protein
VSLPPDSKGIRKNRLQTQRACQIDLTGSLLVQRSRQSRPAERSRRRPGCGEDNSKRKDLNCHGI